MGFMTKTTIYRCTTAGAYVTDGSFSGGTYAPIIIRASVQPLTGGERTTLNEKFGTDTFSGVKIYTASELICDKQNGVMQEADYLYYEGVFWKIVSRDAFDSIREMKHRKYYAMEVAYDQQPKTSAS